MRLLLIMRLLLFTIGLKLSRGYYNRGGYYPSAVTITGNTVSIDCVIQTFSERIINLTSNRYQKVVGQNGVGKGI